MVQFQGKLFTPSFLQAAVAGPFLGIDFLRKLRITVAPEDSQIMFACMAVAQTADKTSLPSFYKHAAGLPTTPGATPPKARVPQVNSFQSSSQANQSIVDSGGQVTF